MAVKRRIGEALSGFVEGFLPAWQQQEYVKRMERGEARVERRDLAADLASEQELLRSEFRTQDDVEAGLSRIVNLNPGADRDTVREALESALLSDERRVAALFSQLDPVQRLHMTPESIIAQAPGVGLTREAFQLKNLPSRSLVGVLPGKQYYPGTPPPQLMTPLKIAGEGPEIESPPSSRILPWSDIAPLVQESRWGGPVAEQFEALQAGGREAQEAALQRAFDLEQTFKTSDAVRAAQTQNDIQNQYSSDNVARLVAEAVALGDVALAQSLSDYKQKLELTHVDRQKWWATETGQNVARQTAVYEALTPEAVDREALLLQMSLQKRLQDDMVRLDEPFARAEARRAATIEEAVAEIRLNDEMKRMDPDHPFQAAFLRDFEKRNALQLYMNQGRPAFAIEFSAEGEPQNSLIMTRGREGLWRYDRMHGFFPLLHPELAAAASAGLDLTQIMDLLGGTPGETLDDTGAGPPGAPGVDPTAGQGDLWGLGDDTAYGGPGAPVRLTPTGPQWQFGAFPMATSGVSPMRGGEYVGGRPSAWLDPEGALAMEISQYQSGLVDLERETAQLTEELEMLQTDPNLPAGYARGKQAELQERQRINAGLQAQLNARIAEISAWFQTR